MRFDFGTIIAVLAALLFYVRLILLQRQRAKQNQAFRSAQGKKKAGSVDAGKQGLVRNWVLVGAGVLLIGVGAVLSVAPGVSVEIRSYWWAPLTVGILLMTLGIG